MPHITTTDGVELYYTEHGTGQPILFSHGWPLSSDAWQLELKLFADAGFRAIAHDRRGHGRSSSTYTSNDMDTYARDLAELVEALDLHDLIVVGHSTGGGEVVRYAAQHGQGRVVKVITVGAIPPLMLQTDANPEGTPIEVFDQIREGVAGDRSQYYHELAEPFYGANRAGSSVSQGTKDAFWLMSMTVGVKGAYDCVKAFSETDTTEDLKKIDIPVLVLHGDDDQIVPIQSAGLKSVKLLSDGTLKVYPGASHGLTGPHELEFNDDLMKFINS
jgi:non-heme chloroperoxidase